MLNKKIKLFFIFSTSLILVSCSNTIKYTADLTNKINIENSIHKSIKGLKQLNNKFYRIDALFWKNTIILMGFAQDQKSIDYIIENISHKYSYKLINNIKIKSKYLVGESTIDSLITANIKRKLVFTKNVKSSNLKIITYDGLVYVFSEEKVNNIDNIIKAIKTIPGVKGIFTYLD